MKKPITIFLLTAVVTGQQAIAQNDSWIQVEGNGFGQDNAGIYSMDAFNGYIFAGTCVTGTGSAAQLWSSTSGEVNSYNQVTSFTPALNALDYNIAALSHSSLSPAYMYMGVANRNAGAVIYSSPDGNSWTRLSKRGFGTIRNTGLSSDLVVFKGSQSSNYVYAGVCDTTAGGAASVWRTVYGDMDSTHWTKVLDFTSLNTSVKNVSCLYAWNNMIFAAVYDSVAHLYQSADGVTWTLSSGVGNGFGFISNYSISSLCAYNGLLYAGTVNTATGGQLWATSDGLSWNLVNGNGFGWGGTIYELRRMIAANGFLWVTGTSVFNQSYNYGDLVFRSADGVNWTQSNYPGYYDIANSRGFNCLTALNGYVYEGIQDTVYGGQIWRTGAGVPKAGFSVNDSVICSGYAGVFTDKSSLADLYEWYVNGVQFASTEDAEFLFSNAGTDTVMQVVYNLSTSLSDTAVDVITVKNCPAGIAEYTNANSVEVYPNPAEENGTITIKYTLSETQPVRIGLFDITGGKISTLYESTDVSGDYQQTVGLNALPAGMYFIRLNNQTQKVLIQ